MKKVPPKSSSLRKTAVLMVNPSKNMSIMTNLSTEQATAPPPHPPFSPDNITGARGLIQQMTTTTDEQQRRDHRQRRSQTPKRPNKCQTTGRNADSRQQSSNNCDRKPETRNRYEALTDELIEGGITFHQPWHN